MAISGEQHALHLKELASDYIARESNRESLITITNVELTRAGDRVTFYVSIYPESAEGPALGFLMRKRGEVREYMKTNGALGRLPHVEFELDAGEKRRQRVDELLQG